MRFIENDRFLQFYVGTKLLYGHREDCILARPPKRFLREEDWETVKEWMMGCMGRRWYVLEYHPPFFPTKYYLYRYVVVDITPVLEEKRDPYKERVKACGVFC